MKKRFLKIFRRKWFALSLLTVMALSLDLFLLGTWINRKVSRETQQFIYEDVKRIPSVKCGLVLGTSQRTRGGGTNLYFEYRLRAAMELFKAGKIRYIIVSGDNGTRYYNEPMDMKDELVKRGVPDSCIYLDYAGFRTLDSVIRCGEIFSQDSITIITQQFQLERALYIARAKGLRAIGYRARDVDLSVNKRVMFREWFARIKLFSDLYVFNIQPKYLGEKVNIP